jgi:tetratricopeptide (TPR) repeat protein
VNRIWTYSLVVAALVSSSPAGVAADPQTAASAKASLQRAVDAGRIEGVLTARAAFEALETADPKSPWPPYWVALADWRAVPMLQMRGNDKLAKATADHGLAAIERALGRRPHEPEALALQAGLLGLTLPFRDSGDLMSLGMQMQALYDEAAAGDSANPRVRFFEALNTMHKPRFVGGGAERALPRFIAAAAAFEHARTTDPLAPDWGRDDILLWAGRAALAAGDPKQAKALYERALAANPDNGWLTRTLIPQADSALAKGPSTK